MLQRRLRAAKAKARIQFAGASEMHDTGGRLTCDRGWRMSKLRPLLPAPPLMHHCGKRLRRAASAAKPPAPLQVALARCPPQQTKRACAGPSSSASYQRATRRRLRCFVAGLPAANKALCRGCATATAAQAFYSIVDNKNNIKPHSRSTQRARVIRCNSHPARWLHISRTAAAVATANTSLQWPQSTLGSAAAAPTAAHSCALRLTGQPHCKRGVAHAAHLVAAVAVKLHDVLMQLLQAAAVRDGEQRDAQVLAALLHLALPQHGDSAAALVHNRVLGLVVQQARRRKLLLLAPAHHILPTPSHCPCPRSARPLPQAPQLL